MAGPGGCVVIGGGGLGTATAFHLVKAGLSVALVDRVGFASQTSARAAGLSGMLRTDEAMTRIAAMGVQKIERFTEETGEALTYFQPGSLKVARRPIMRSNSPQRWRAGSAWAWMSSCCRWKRRGGSCRFCTPRA